MTWGARVWLVAAAVGAGGCADLIGLDKGQLEPRPPCSGTGGRLVAPASVWTEEGTSADRETAGEVTVFDTDGKAAYLDWTTGSKLHFVFPEVGAPDVADEWSKIDPVRFHPARLASDGVWIYLAADLPEGEVAPAAVACIEDPSTSLLARLTTSGGECTKGVPLGDSSSTAVRAVAATPGAVAVVVRAFVPATSGCGGDAPGLHLRSYDGDLECNAPMSLVLEGDVDVTALAYDDGGGLWLAGEYDTSTGAVGILDADGFPESDDRDVFLMRVDPGGERVVTALRAPSAQAVTGIVALPGGDVVISGTYEEDLDFDDVCPPLPAAGDAELNAFVARIAGGEVAWSVGLGNEQYAEAPIGLDASGDGIYVAGSFLGQVTFGGSDPAEAVGASSGFVTRLDGSGNFEWTMILRGAETQATDVEPEVNIQGMAAGAGATEDVYVTGSFRGVVDLGQGPVESSAAGGASPFVMRVRANGGP